ncbi:Cyanamide hydratase- HD-type [Apiospora saccharicola]|uniref:Cyanamide hydratase- HD-type n=1 Tax=Apiospora saccharicola TaxID=335842 RepID=A0ABR1UWY8_9PEZI
MSSAAAAAAAAAAASTTPAASAEDIAKHGWTAVPLDADAIFGDKPFLHEPVPVLVDDIPFPSDDPLVAKVQEYVRRELPEPTFNHSMRVYNFGYIILKHQFQEHFESISLSTWALTALLHDIGTARRNLTSTLLSFEFWGGFHALDLLSSSSSLLRKESGDVAAAPKPQAEAVAEAIIRHQDLGTEGKISLLGQVVQLATLYDNMGLRPGLVHARTRDAVVGNWPRLGWSSCFEGVICEEMGLKPWAHTSHSGEAFPKGVKENGETGLMSEYEK